MMSKTSFDVMVSGKFHKFIENNADFDLERSEIRKFIAKSIDKMLVSKDFLDKVKNVKKEAKEKEFKRLQDFEKQILAQQKAETLPTQPLSATPPSTQPPSATQTQSETENTQTQDENKAKGTNAEDLSDTEFDISVIDDLESQENLKTVKRIKIEK